MLVRLSPAWLVVANVIAWLVIHLGVAWIGVLLPGRWFRPGSWLYGEWACECGGRLWERMFRVRRWKGMLPDGAVIFRGGFPKARLSGSDPAYLERFVRETCRGEAVHWVVFACALLFFLWNPWWIGLIMVAYAAAVNVPCIIAQRYNRIRLVRLSTLCGRRHLR